MMPEVRISAATPTTVREMVAATDHIPLAQRLPRYRLPYKLIPDRVPQIDGPQPFGVLAFAYCYYIQALLDSLMPR